MITDNDLFAAICDTIKQVERNEISINIAIRDIRKAVKIFDQQDSEITTIGPVESLGPVFKD